MTTTATAAPIPKTIPYRKGGEIDYASLDFNPDEPHRPEDAMLQDKQIGELWAILHGLFTDFFTRKDTLVTMGAIICYDPSNLNVHVSPDICVAFGVDEDAIVNRRIYLPWEAGKPPDWVLEVASPSTARVDVGRKVSIYERIKVPEYWLLDPTGGELYGFPLAGYRLESGIYRPVAITDEPDGILKGYSEILRLSLCWDNGMPRLYSPSSGTYIQNLKEARDSWDSDRVVWEADRVVWEADRAAWGEDRASWEADRIAFEMEISHLREMLRRRQAEE